MPHQHITGLNPQQFAPLLTALNNYLTWRKPDTKPRRLTLTQALKITLLYHRYNLTEDFLAYIFSISQPTVSRTINLIEKTLDKVLQPVVQPLEKALEVPGSLVIDGTLILTWNWRSQGKQTSLVSIRKLVLIIRSSAPLMGNCWLLLILCRVRGMMLTLSGCMDWRGI